MENRTEGVKVSRSGRWGFWLSIACAVHCAATPLVLTAVPMAGGAGIDSPWLEFALIGAGVTFGLYNVIRDYLHRKYDLRPVATAATGALLLGCSHFIAPEAWEVPFMVLGAGLIGLAQILNARVAHTCPT